VRRRWKVIAAFAIAGLISTAFFVLRSTPEPEYDGKPLSYWLNELHRSIDRSATTFPARKEEWYSDPKATNALTHIGTNAYPQVISWTARETPRFITVAASKLHLKLLGNLIGQDFMQKEQVSTYFSWMGSRASAAVPMLSNIVVTARENSFTRIFALHHLRVIGGGGQPALIALKHNTNLPMETRVRCMVDLITEYNTERLSGGDQELDLARSLQQCEADPDPAFRAEAKAVFQRQAPNLWTNNAATN
jgi:hypothetical protein